MGSRALRASLLVAFFLLVPVAAADDKKPAGKDDKTKPVSADTLPNGAYAGKILQLPDDDGKFTAQVDITHYEPKDPKHADAYAKAMQQVTREQERVAQLEHDYATAKKPQEQAKKLKQLENAQAELERRMEKAAQDIKVVTEHKTVEFQLSRDAKIRIMV